MGVYVFVTSKDPHSTGMFQRLPETEALLCVEHGKNGANVLTQEEINHLKGEATPMNEQSYTKDQVRDLISQVMLDFAKMSKAGPIEIADINAAVETYLEASNV